MLQTKQEVSYDTIKSIIRGNGEVKDLKRNLGQARETLQTLVSDADKILKTRIAKLVIEEGLGFYVVGECNQKALSKIFPDTEYETSRMTNQGVTTLNLKNEHETHTVYYSRSLGIWVSGEPKQKEDGLYCQITDEKISY